MKKSSTDILCAILSSRGMTNQLDIDAYLQPVHPDTLPLALMGIQEENLKNAVGRIRKAIQEKESIVVYTDYDADGLTAGAIVWESIHALGGRIMPYVPHRVEEGYGLTKQGIDSILEKYQPTLLITVDHGVSSMSETAYAKSKGIDVIITDHHLKPDQLPDAMIVHTTALSGAGVAYVLVKELLQDHTMLGDLLALAAIGTIADMMPLLGINRSIARYGIQKLKETNRKGILSLLSQAGFDQHQVSSHTVSHVLAPRLNAAGRIEHAIDALRLLCTFNAEKADALAEKLEQLNRERQKLTIDTALHAKEMVKNLYGEIVGKKLLFLSHESYNQGIIGLVAGKLVETYALPSVVVSKGETISKASARSIRGFNIVEAIRKQQDLIINAGGHPLAAGFTVETDKLELLKERLEEAAEMEITADVLNVSVPIDMEIPLQSITEELFQCIQKMQPFGFGNAEPVFLTRSLQVIDWRRIGAEGKHLKMHIGSGKTIVEAVGFHMGDRMDALAQGSMIDLAYTLSLNEWNGKQSLQMLIKAFV